MDTVIAICVIVGLLVCFVVWIFVAMDDDALGKAEEFERIEAPNRKSSTGKSSLLKYYCYHHPFRDC